MVSVLLLTGAHADESPREMVLRYSQPAKDWQREALPIGNGRMGGMIFGAVRKERIQFNEDSLWTGDENPSGNYKTMGAYQNFGDLFIELAGISFVKSLKGTGVSNYRRELDLSRAICEVRYERDTTRYRRETFCSHPSQVIVSRLTADKPGRYTGRISLTDAHGAKTVAARNRLTAAGSLPNKLKYEAQALVLNEGGSLEATSGEIRFTGCNSLTLLLAAGTDYLNDGRKKWRGNDPHGRLTRQLQAAAAKPYEALKRSHVADHQSLFHRVHLDLGKTPPRRRDAPTPERLEAYGKDGNDRELEALFFQFGRYLLIGCSRPGSLPETACPILKEVCEFWEDRLKKLEDGTLVAPKGWSPEHGPVEDGVRQEKRISSPHSEVEGARIRRTG